MKFWSTRGEQRTYRLLEGFLLGLANDGGLLVPQTLPALSAQQLASWKTHTFAQLTIELFGLFGIEDVPEATWHAIVQRSYAQFRAPEITPLTRLNDTTDVLELFHGPTFAFKDVALQLMGQLYGYTAQQHGEKIHILGATSGDTGAAAIASVRGIEGIRICILHPHEKVSRVQRLQMTTANDANVLNLAVRGTFDDCQKMIKQLFGKLSFKETYHLRAINSINIVRIISQMVYYFYAYFRMCEKHPDAQISFSVPTGNFGNVLSAYLARKMGLPIHRILLATNANDILTRLVQEGIYRPTTFRSTLSPSMDIQVASNFERYLYYILGEDRHATAQNMATFHDTGELRFTGEILRTIQQDFEAYSVSNEQTRQTIARHDHQDGVLLDPHTACAATAVIQCASQDPRERYVIVSTAHPAKFDEAIHDIHPNQLVPSEIAALEHKKTQMTIVECDLDTVEAQLSRFFG